MPSMRSREGGWGGRRFGWVAVVVSRALDGVNKPMSRPISFDFFWFLHHLNYFFSSALAFLDCKNPRFLWFCPGEFKRLIGEGPSCILWPLQSVVGRLSLRVQQLDVVCETKTKDNVFVQVAVAVQYRVMTESAYDAWYRLTSPTSQIQAYVFDVIRSTVPRLELDQAFESKDDIAQAVLEQLQSVMKDYGYAIVNTLVTDLSPDHKVKASMNEINAAKRLKEAASHQAEADKVRQVKAAEVNKIDSVETFSVFFLAFTRYILLFRCLSRRLKRRLDICLVSAWQGKGRLLYRDFKHPFLNSVMTLREQVQRM